MQTMRRAGSTQDSSGRKQALQLCCILVNVLNGVAAALCCEVEVATPCEGPESCGPPTYADMHAVNQALGTCLHVDLQRHELSLKRRASAPSAGRLFSNGGYRAASNRLSERLGCERLFLQKGGSSQRMDKMRLTRSEAVDLLLAGATGAAMLQAVTGVLGSRIFNASQRATGDNTIQELFPAVTEESFVQLLSAATRCCTELRWALVDALDVCCYAAAQRHGAEAAVAGPAVEGASVMAEMEQVMASDVDDDDQTDEGEEAMIGILPSDILQARRRALGARMCIVVGCFCVSCAGAMRCVWTTLITGTGLFRPGARTQAS